MQILDLPLDPTSGTTHGHVHVPDLDACLDLINSEEFTDGVPQEHLATVDDAVAFLTRRGMGSEPALQAQASAGEAWLERIHGVRAALREVWDARVERRAPSDDALDTVNALLRSASRLELVASGGRVGASRRGTGDDPTGEALARLIEPLVDAIAADATDRFRICANDGCRWVFEDTSRAGRRRWCDMATCGNRAKVRRHRSKLRDAGAGKDNEGVRT